MNRLAALAVVAVVLAPRALHADVERYALLIGNNAGDSDEQQLRYAEDDALRMYDVLRELGGFRPENMTMLRSEDAETVRRSLIALNARIRTQTATGAQSELVVYYSGHSDQTALHLGRSTLDLMQLDQLVRGSAATLRVLILDSCRSGALTRVKGGTIQPGFAIALDQRIPGDGVVLWTASAESENAQESDELRGSFFTHYLVSGLLGAADRDGNGSVTLGEAYQYAYDNTLRATSRTLAGTQHPTFRYELGGHGDVVLTVVDRTDNQRALVSFPDGKSYLLIQGGEDGAVVAEVGAHDRTRRLSVKPGRYFVRGRGPAYLLEGTLALRPAEQHVVRDQELEQIGYARLVRKGRDDLGHASSLQAGYWLRTPLWSGGSLCQGPFAGYAIDLQLVSLAPRVGLCRGTLEQMSAAHADEIDVELRVSHAWDIGRLAVNVGVSIGGSHLRHGAAAGVAPSADDVAHAGVLAGATIDLGRGYYSGIEIDAIEYFRTASLPPIQPSIPLELASAPFNVRFDIVALGKRW